MQESACDLPTAPMPRGRSLVPHPHIRTGKLSAWGHSGLARPVRPDVPSGSIHWGRPPSPRGRFIKLLRRCRQLARPAHRRAQPRSGPRCLLAHSIPGSIGPPAAKLYRDRRVGSRTKEWLEGGRGGPLSKSNPRRIALAPNHETVQRSKFFAYKDHVIVDQFTGRDAHFGAAAGDVHDLTGNTPKTNQSYA